ncbi:imidazolonepropionase [Sphingopyxis sp.]|uniref:imidazolonepropionase n=1 Tax=Sphingopyxis sp. TaxID=1908224 RepID=UPI003BAC4AE4
MHSDRLWTNARLATMQDGASGLGVVERGAVGMTAGTITYVGSMIDAPTATDTIDCDGRWITPGLIDPHTHLIFAGDRIAEFELRQKRASYEDIARSGGGIVSTVHATRAASEAELVTSALPRLDALIAEGVTTIEIKSGYGLSVEDEAKMLRAARILGEVRPVSVRTTFLGAHALPQEYAEDPDGYIDLVCQTMLPDIAAAGLADAVDAFCENIGFTLAQTERVFVAAKKHGLPVKLHAEQLSNQRGAALAARHAALSADHLEYLDDGGIAAMARAGTVAMLLPGAYYFLRETKLPPVAALRAAGIPIALATDCNPGTSPLTSILLTMNMAAVQFGLTVDECLLGVTRQAARALGVGAEVGTLELGKRCDLAIWDIERPADLVGRIGFNPLHQRIWMGQ